MPEDTPLPIPNTISTFPPTHPDLDEYIQSMTEKERKAYRIAESHLGSSFSLEKSVGFIVWKTKQTASDG